MEEKGEIKRQRETKRRENQITNSWKKRRITKWNGKKNDMDGEYEEEYKKREENNNRKDSEQNHKTKAKRIKGRIRYEGRKNN